MADISSRRIGKLWTTRIGFVACDAFCNPAGAIQGGLLAAMLDDTLGPAVLVATGGSHYTATIDLNVSFLAPARPGPLIGKGRVVKLGRMIAFLEGQLLDGDCEPVTRANASVRVIPTASLLR